MRVSKIKFVLRREGRERARARARGPIPLGDSRASLSLRLLYADRYRGSLSPGWTFRTPERLGRTYAMNSLLLLVNLLGLAIMVTLFHRRAGGRKERRRERDM